MLALRQISVELDSDMEKRKGNCERSSSFYSQNCKFVWFRLLFSETGNCECEVNLINASISHKKRLWIAYKLTIARNDHNSEKKKRRSELDFVGNSARKDQKSTQKWSKILQVKYESIELQLKR